jgi:hypothetical protein
MKRVVSFVLALLLPVLASGQDLPAKYLAALNETGAGLSQGLIFHAPFTDPATPLAIYKGTGPFTFARAHDATHTATFVHPVTGLVTVASADQLRIEADGALIEGARTNILTYSESLQTIGGGAWGISSAGTGTNPVVTGNNGVAPDGSSTAERIVFDKGAGTTAGDYSVFFHTEQSGLAVPHKVSMSVWLKSNTGASYDILFRDGYGGFSTVVTVTGSWTRFTGSSAAVSQTGAEFDLLLQGGASTSDNADILAWGAQVEIAASPSSYMGPTAAGTMSRNLDDLTIPQSGNIDPLVGTVMLQFNISAPDPTNEVAVILAGSGSTQILAVDKNLGMYTLDAASHSKYNSIPTYLTNHLAAVRWGGASMSNVLDGATIATGTFGTGIVTGADLYVGDYGAIRGLIPAFGHIKNLRIWNRKMSDAELQGMTR